MCGGSRVDPVAKGKYTGSTRLRVVVRNHVREHVSSRAEPISAAVL
jgi:hypothetical protein